MESRDILRVTFDQNPAMAEAVAQIDPGDKLEGKYIGVLKSKDSEGVDIVLTAVIPEGFEIDEDQVGRVPMGGPMSTEPTLSPSAMLVKRKTQ